MADSQSNDDAAVVAAGDSEDQAKVSEIVEAEVLRPDETVLPSGRRCVGCAAPLDVDDAFCSFCAIPQTTEHELSDDASVNANAPRQTVFQCESCGARVATAGDTRSFRCPFCDSTYVIDFAAGVNQRQAPEFVIGFQLTPEKVREKFRQWIGKSGWFEPSDLKKAEISDKIQGIYLPFWSFSMLAQSKWWTRIGEHWYRTETYTAWVNGKAVTRTRRVQETEWWDLSGDHQRYHRGYLVSGSRGLSQEDADRIAPFHLAGFKRYKPSFLAGWLSEEYSVDREEALDRCRTVFTRREEGSVGAFMPGDTYRKLRVQTAFTHVESDLTLLPVYILSYRYGEQVFRFMVNGQTGKVVGDKPRSNKRIGAAIGAALALLGIVILLLLLFVR